jgi:hypothetical protein
VVVAACLLVAAAFGVLMLAGRWVRKLGDPGIVGMPVLAFALGCIALAYWAALSWMLCGSVCNPVTAMSELPKGRRAIFVLMAILPPLTLLGLLLR